MDDAELNLASQETDRFPEVYHRVKEMLEKGWKPAIITYNTIIGSLFWGWIN